MKLPKSVAMAFCVGLFLLSSSLSADQWDQKTKVTFSGPVQVAKTMLPAGTYIFKLLDTTDRQVVQIFNEDETHLITTVLTTADYRLEAADKTAIKFSESGSESDASGTLPAAGVPIKSWFYPGDEFGHDFRVSKHHRNEAAAEPPAATESAAMATPEAPPAAAEPQQPVETAPAAPEAAAPQPVAPAAPEPPAAQPRPQVTQPAPAAPGQLPQTASQLPVVGLIGLVSLVVAAGFRSLCKDEGANRH